ncbi:4918_t:CDS:2 [Ambispora gerdemannii]|uniref:4918_t:CDS:1 n=1 Tax=Ambispora gerdemannii TaxID=144530 RepID=A0A9N8VIK7_9GLOM|nr:4918_t:CDS:2 [Ambispora gerdemannii]
MAIEASGRFSKVQYFCPKIIMIDVIKRFLQFAGEKEKIYFQNHHDKSSINQFNISSMNNQIIKEQQQPTLEVDDKQPQSVFSEKQIGEALSMHKIMGKNKKKEYRIIKTESPGKCKKFSDNYGNTRRLYSDDLGRVEGWRKYHDKTASDSMGEINTGNLDTSNSVSRRSNILSERQKKQSADPIIKSVVAYHDEKNDEALSEFSSEGDDLPLLDLIDSFDIMSGEYPLEEDIAKQINDCSNKRLWLSILEYQDINFDQTLRSQ